MQTAYQYHLIHIYRRHANCLPRPFSTHLLQTCKLPAKTISTHLLQTWQTACQFHLIHICCKTCKLPAKTIQYTSVADRQTACQDHSVHIVADMQTACPYHLIHICCRHANCLPKLFSTHLLQTCKLPANTI